MDRQGLRRVRDRDRDHRGGAGGDQAVRGPPGARRAHAAALRSALVAGAAALLADPGGGGGRGGGGSRRCGRAFGGGLGPRGPPAPAPGRQLSSLIRGTAAVVGRGDLAVAIALSAAAWILWAAGLWLVADSLGIDLALWQAAFMTGLVNLGTAVPSSPGFVGTYQWLCVSGLGLFDVGARQAFAVSLVLQAAWVVPTTAAGGAPGP